MDLRNEGPKGTNWIKITEIHYLNKGSIKKIKNNIVQAQLCNYARNSQFGFWNYFYIRVDCATNGAWTHDPGPGGISNKWIGPMSPTDYDRAVMNIVCKKTVNNAKNVLSVEQRKLTNTEWFGDFSKASKKKTIGKVVLTVWAPYIQHLQKIGATAIIPKTTVLTVDFDEIWELKYADISRLYWKDGKIQAGLSLKEYISDPITNQKFPSPEYKITYIGSRAEMLQNN
jgi:hypothetical protein